MVGCEMLLRQHWDYPAADPAWSSTASRPFGDAPAAQKSLAPGAAYQAASRRGILACCLSLSLVISRSGRARVCARSLCCYPSSKRGRDPCRAESRYPAKAQRPAMQGIYSTEGNPSMAGQSNKQGYCICMSRCFGVWGKPHRNSGGPAHPRAHRIGGLEQKPQSCVTRQARGHSLATRGRKEARSSLRIAAGRGGCKSGRPRPQGLIFVLTAFRHEPDAAAHTGCSTADTAAVSVVYSRAPRSHEGGEDRSCRSTAV
ncbi:hypothetical protein GQ53DRAFT_156014 [Thozetella sp. PMI_491]|nr:hypothetical protein GQ53DRAFT_156014 [Thozetella sp. PMI_491]